jgi:hypothetical protein
MTQFVHSTWTMIPSTGLNLSIHISMKHRLFIEALMFHSTTVKVRTCDKIEYGVYTQNIVSSVHAFTLSFSCLSCVIQANATVRGEY